VPVVGRVPAVVPVEVKVVEKPPEVIKDELLARVRVALVAGAVTATLFTDVAVATPISGVVKVGLTEVTNVVPVPV
jgi:hypothetical protein